ncbi:hypothetical protein V8E53_001694 [Lactarius tabidus]
MPGSQSTPFLRLLPHAEHYYERLTNVQLALILQQPDARACLSHMNYDKNARLVVCNPHEITHTSTYKSARQAAGLRWYTQYLAVALASAGARVRGYRRPREHPKLCGAQTSANFFKSLLDPKTVSAPTPLLPPNNPTPRQASLAKNYEKKARFADRNSRWVIFRAPTDPLRRQLLASSGPGIIVLFVADGQARASLDELQQACPEPDAAHLEEPADSQGACRGSLCHSAVRRNTPTEKLAAIALTTLCGSARGCGASGSEGSQADVWDVGCGTEEGLTSFVTLKVIARDGHALLFDARDAIEPWCTVAHGNQIPVAASGSPDSEMAITGPAERTENHPRHPPHCQY